MKIIRSAVKILPILIPVFVMVSLGSVIETLVFHGDLMKPTIRDGEYLLVNKLAYRVEEPKRGDIIVFHDPDSPRQKVNRILALPGEITFADLHTGKYGYLPFDQKPLSEEMSQEEIERLFTTIHWLDFPRFSPTIPDTDLYARISMTEVTEDFLDSYKVISDTYTEFDPNMGVGFPVHPNQIVGRIVFIGPGWLAWLAPVLIFTIVFLSIILIQFVVNRYRRPQTGTAQTK